VPLTRSAQPVELNNARSWERSSLFQLCHGSSTVASGVPELDGEKPVIIMPPDPQLRALYRQKSLPRRAKDMGIVVGNKLRSLQDVRKSARPNSRCEHPLVHHLLLPAIGFLALEEVVAADQRLNLSGFPAHDGEVRGGPGSTRVQSMKCRGA
jgi:hypothetical protein